MTVYQQSSVIPYRVKKGRLEFLLITTRKGRWIVPKGLVDPGFTPIEAAAQEAEEEAGITGRFLPDPIGQYAYFKWGGRCDVTMYAMEVLDQQSSWLEDHFREREWMAPEKAVKRVKNKDLKKLIQRAEEILK